MTPDPTAEARAFDIAEGVVDDWDSYENESMRDDHRSTMRRLIMEALLAFRKEGAERAEKERDYWKDASIRDCQRIASLEAELALNRRAAEKHYAESARLREELDQERACHDCKEYRLMMAEKVRSLEAELARVQNDLDAAAKWIRCVIEESVIHGGEAGDRTVTLANLRATYKERDALRARLSPERLEKVAQAIEQKLYGVGDPDDVASILAVLQRELAK